MSRPVWFTIVQKELMDASRDRRAMMALLIFPLLGPALIYYMLTSQLDIRDDARQALEVPVVGGENARDLIDYLRQAGLTINPVALPEGIRGPGFSADLQTFVEALIDDRREDFVLVIPAGFGYKIGQSRSVNVELHFDSSRQAALPSIARLESLIQAWSKETAVLRLLARGIDPAIVSPVALQRIDVASPQARAQVILGMIPLFVIMAALVSGMGVAVDATAGERERKSLEPLLVHPVPRSSIVAGKWLAATVFSAIGLVIVMVLTLFALSRVPLEQVGLTFAIGPHEAMSILITTLPLAFLATSMQLFLGIFAKSLKDAQTYLSLITLLPMAPYIYNIFNTQGREFWMNFIPMLGQTMLLDDVIGGRQPALLDFILSAAMVLLCSLVFILLAAQVFKREHIICS